MCADPWLIVEMPDVPPLVKDLLGRCRYFVDRYDDRIEIMVVGYDRICLCEAPDLEALFLAVMDELLRHVPQLVYYRCDIRDRGMTEVTLSPEQAVELYPPSLAGEMRRIVVTRSTASLQSRNSQVD